MNRGSIFAEHDAFEERLIGDPAKLDLMITSLKALGLRIVLTSGSYDLAHIGHMRYLREARKLGDVLVVGVDSDEKVQARKGKNRPITPEQERAEMLAHSRYADIISIKKQSDEKWALIKLVRPDILVISERAGNTEEARQELLKYCGEIRELESQAKTSTSAAVRKLQVEVLKPNLERMRSLLDDIESALP